MLQRYCHQNYLVFININYFWWSHNTTKETFLVLFCFHLTFFFQLLLQKLISFMTYSFSFKLISCYFGYIHMLQLKSWLFWRLCNGTKNLDIDILSTLLLASDFLLFLYTIFILPNIIKNSHKTQVYRRSQIFAIKTKKHVLAM